MTEAQLELEPEPHAELAFEWSHLGPYDHNSRFCEPGGRIAAFAFDSSDGWRVVLYTARGPAPEGELGPFPTLELAQEYAGAEAGRRGLLAPAMERGLCCACGHHRCGSCT